MPMSVIYEQLVDVQHFSVAGVAIDDRATWDGILGGVAASARLVMPRVYGHPVVTGDHGCACRALKTGSVFTGLPACAGNDDGEGPLNEPSGRNPIQLSNSPRSQR